MSCQNEFNKRCDELEQRINAVDVHFDRIEEKVNYIISLLETLFEDEDEDEYEENDEDNGNEGWIADLDAWKDSYDED